MSIETDSFVSFLASPYSRLSGVDDLESIGSVLEALLCTNCTHFYDASSRSPRLLPCCGRAICRSCAFRVSRPPSVGFSCSCGRSTIFNHSNRDWPHVDDETAFLVEFVAPMDGNVANVGMSDILSRVRLFVARGYRFERRTTAGTSLGNNSLDGAPAAFMTNGSSDVRVSSGRQAGASTSPSSPAAPVANNNDLEYRMDHERLRAIWVQNEAEARAVEQSEMQRMADRRNAVLTGALYGLYLVLRQQALSASGESQHSAARVTPGQSGRLQAPNVPSARRALRGDDHASRLQQRSSNEQPSGQAQSLALSNGPWLERSDPMFNGPRFGRSAPLVNGQQYEQPWTFVWGQHAGQSQPRFGPSPSLIDEPPSRQWQPSLHGQTSGQPWHASPRNEQRVPEQQLASSCVPSVSPSTEPPGTGSSPPLLRQDSGQHSPAELVDGRHLGPIPSGTFQSSPPAVTRAENEVEPFEGDGVHHVLPSIPAPREQVTVELSPSDARLGEPVQTESDDEAMSTVYVRRAMIRGEGVVVFFTADLGYVHLQDVRQVDFYQNHLGNFDDTDASSSSERNDLRQASGPNIYTNTTYTMAPEDGGGDGTQRSRQPVSMRRLDSFSVLLPSLSDREMQETCVICQETLAQPSAYSDRPHGDAMQVIRFACSHLFHLCCAERLVRLHFRDSLRILQCPVCKRQLY